MLAHGQDCHVINTASAVGLHTVPSFASYCVSKAAVVALSEALAAEVAAVPGARLRVSVLCPGSVVTNLSPENIGGRTDRMDPDWIAEHVWQALQDGAFWVLPMQEDMRAAALDRLRRLEGELAVAPVPGAPRPAVSPTFLTEYFERVDGPDPASALDLVAEDASFSFARPDERIEGGRDELARYIGVRTPLGHRLLRSAQDRDVAFVLGESVDGATSLGTFLAGARRDQSGRIDRYLASFYPE
jgi:short chain dehydrogenase